MNKIVKIAALTTIAISSLASVCGCSCGSEKLAKDGKISYYTFKKEADMVSEENNKISEYEYKLTTKELNSNNKAVYFGSVSFTSPKEFIVEMNSNLIDGISIKNQSIKYDGEYFYIGDYGSEFKVKKENIDALSNYQDIIYFINSQKIISMKDQLELLDRKNATYPFNCSKYTEKNTVIYSLLNDENERDKYVYQDGQLVEVYSKFVTETVTQELSYIKKDIKIDIDANAFELEKIYQLDDFITWFDLQKDLPKHLEKYNYNEYSEQTSKNVKETKSINAKVDFLNQKGIFNFETNLVDSGVDNVEFIKYDENIYFYNKTNKLELYDPKLNNEYQDQYKQILDNEYGILSVNYNNVYFIINFLYAEKDDALIYKTVKDDAITIILNGKLRLNTDNNFVYLSDYTVRITYKANKLISMYVDSVSLDTRCDYKLNRSYITDDTIDIKNPEIK